MGLGPIFERELLVLARRRRNYIARMEAAAAPLIMAVACFIVWIFWKGTGWQFTISHAEMARLGQITFGMAVAIQVLMVYIISIEQSSRAIARERDGRTLPLLLTTRMSSAQIVLGTLFADLLRTVSMLAVGVPISALLLLTGGIDPMLVPLAYAAILATTWMVSCLSIWASAESANARAAARLATLVSQFWLLGPIFTSLLLPKFWPAFARAVNPAMQWLSASSPLNLQMSFVTAFGLMTRARIMREVLWMIGLELLGGTLFVALAIVRLRPASRQVEGGDGGLFRFRFNTKRFYRILPRWRLREDPMLWKELTTIRQGGPAQISSWVIALAIFAGLGYLTSRFVIPAMQEVWAEGYGGTRMTMARDHLNAFVRGMSVCGSLMLGLLVAGLAAESIGTERSKQTWTSLLVTQLDGPEILRAKLLGALWLPRWGYVLLALMWISAALAGGVHPLALPAAALVLASWLWLAAAWGVYFSLVCPDIKQATNSTLLPLLCTMASGLAPFLLNGRGGSVLMGILSPPFGQVVSLVSYAEVDGLFHGGTVALDGVGALSTGEGPLRYLVACALSIVISLIAAWYLTRLANRRFDAACGRPQRPTARALASLQARAQNAARPALPYALVYGSADATSQARNGNGALHS